MSDTPTFSSPNIANEMEKVFGSDAKKVDVDIKFKHQVGDFILKVNRMHDEAKKSKQIFK